jgi:hypothetical protein
VALKMVMAMRETVDRRKLNVCGLHVSCHVPQYHILSITGVFFGQETWSVFSQRLGVAPNQALERRLGKVPSPIAASKATEAIYRTKGSTFVRHVARVQERLANLHAQLERN